ncbi:MAG TPA: hypothetical protein VGI60_01795 [Chthoniobacterales bacterium]
MRALERNAELLRLLKAFRADPPLVVQLYEALFFGRFWVLAQEPADISRMAFLTYPTKGSVRELPIFTAPDRPALTELAAESGAASLEIDGISLWPRLLEIVKTGETEAAVDAGESYAIRVNWQMILMMLRIHGDSIQLPENI